MSQKTHLSLAFICLLSASTSFAGNNTKSCLEQATNAAGYYLSDTQEQYNEGKEDANLAAAESTTGGFEKGEHDSSTKQGLVYFKFGNDSGGSYIVTAYMGSHCGAATNTKLFCSLKKAGSDWTDLSSAPPVPVAGFYMECEVCRGVKLNSAGNEVGATASAHLPKTTLLTQIELLNSAIQTANYHGVSMVQSSAAWPSGNCNTTTI